MPANAQSKQFAVLNGKIVTCAEAFKFRDGRLHEELLVLLKAYDKDKATRQKEIRAEFQKHIAQLEKDWADAKPEMQKTIIVNSISLIFSIGGDHLGKTMSKISGLTGLEKNAAEFVTSRSLETKGLIIKAGFKQDIPPSDLIGLPLGIVAALGTPIIGQAVLAYGIGTGVVSLGIAGYDYYLTEVQYDQDIDNLKKALDRLIDRSVDLQIGRINSLKNDIDARCG